MLGFALGGRHRINGFNVLTQMVNFSHPKVDCQKMHAIPIEDL